MNLETISQLDYLQVIQESQAHGLQGGIVHDAIHASIARRLRVERLVTYNITNVRHVAPDLEVFAP